MTDKKVNPPPQEQSDIPEYMDSIEAQKYYKNQKVKKRKQREQMDLEEFEDELDAETLRMVKKCLK